MKLSREYVISEMESMRKGLSDWIRELKAPSRLEPDGKTATPIYGEEGPPKGLSVDNVEGIPVDQLKAELVAMSRRLEALGISE